MQASLAAPEKTGFSNSHPPKGVLAISAPSWRPPNRNPPVAPRGHRGFSCAPALHVTSHPARNFVQTPHV